MLKKMFLQTTVQDYELDGIPKKRHLSEATKQKMRDSHKKLIGDKNPFYGHHHSDETKIKMGDSNRGKKQSKETKIKISRSKLGDKNPLWKGDDVSYNALHTWISKNKNKPAVCEQCQKNAPYDVANVSGEYKRDINDFRWLCRRCHMLEDGRMKNLKHQNGIKMEE